MNILTSLVLLLLSSTNALDSSIENNDTNQDMYVIHAMVYQVGIITNSSDESSDENNIQMGNQEALTFYHKNGSDIDLGQIPEPLLTNITGQSFVGLAPIMSNDNNNSSSDSDLKLSNDRKGASTTSISRNIPPSGDVQNESTYHKLSSIFKTNVKREVMENENNNDNLFKIMNGTAIIPKEAAVQSIALPPLLSLNANLSEIPVPIPNTSIVQYAKINTLIKSNNGSTT